MNKSMIFIVTVMFLFLITFSSAGFEYYKPQKQDQQFTFCQQCSSSTYITLATIATPSTTEIININMTPTGSGSFCYNYTATEQGEYDFRGAMDGCLNDWGVKIPVTANGDIMTTGQSIFYIILIVFVSFLFCLFFYMAVKFKYNNIIEEYGRELVVKDINKLKYIKLISMWISYGLFLWLITIITGMTNNYITFGPLRELTTNLYTWLSVLGYGVTVAIGWFIFINLWRDIILNKQILRAGMAFIDNKHGRN